MRLPIGVDYAGAAPRPSIAFQHRKTPREITAIILHSGDGTLAGDLDTLCDSRNRSAHYYVAKDGRVWQLVREADVAFHVGQCDALKHCNLHTIGIETQHLDGADDWPDTQVLAIGVLVADIRRRLGFLPVLSHASVARPKGRKIDPLAFPWQHLAAIVARASGHAALADPSDLLHTAPEPRTPS